MNYNKAKSTYGSRHDKGRKAGMEYEFPYGNRYADDTFVEVNIPTKFLNIERYKVHEEFVEKYTETLQISEMDPIWIQAGKKLKSGMVMPFHDNKVLVVDGNHRLHAQLNLGREKVTVIVPRSHIKLLGEMHG